MKINILGVKIDQINLDGVLAKISDWLKSDGQHYIATVNPEFVMAAQKNQEFKNVLNNADIATCDGIGLVWASGGKLIRVTGVDIVEQLLNSKSEYQNLKRIQNSNFQNSKIFLLGGEEGTAQVLIKKYPNANIVSAERGGKINLQNYKLDNNKEIIKKINSSNANILLVGFGQVKQEMWIAQNLAQMPNIKVAIGIGGTFDYLSGKIKRAPKWVRGLGLEWLFRLLTQPKRLNRIFNATIKFSWLILKNKFKRINP